MTVHECLKNDFCTYAKNAIYIMCCLAYYKSSMQKSLQRQANENFPCISLFLKGKFKLRIRTTL